MWHKEAQSWISLLGDLLPCISRVFLTTRRGRDPMVRWRERRGQLFLDRAPPLKKLLRGGSRCWGMTDTHVFRHICDGCICFEMSRANGFGRPSPSRPLEKCLANYAMILSQNPLIRDLARGNFEKLVAWFLYSCKIQITINDEISTSWKEKHVSFGEKKLLR